ncbi:glycosyltransferase family 39 protein [Candidatus Daviesbacteria bacterium]|nr:glycosyltransferase family 39 protein [Candidatus Daviesbacteria bacterium]
MWKIKSLLINRSSKILLLLLVVTLIYANSLDRTPVHLNRDELGFSLNAYSIAKTGFDENGRFLPLYFWHLGVMWATPVIVYLTALFLTIFPLSEITIRLPTVMVGLLNIILIYFLAKKVFDNEKLGLFAALFLALTPVHFIQSRILLDNLFPIPFVLGWMIFLYLFFSRKNLWFLFFAALLLGIGIHSYHATKVIMPIYLILTLIITFKLSKNKLTILIPLIAFILPLLPLIPWLSQYPDTLTDQVRYVGLYDTKLDPISGIITLLKPEIISQRLAVYLKYFDPTFLFFKGDSSLIHSTGRVGVFLLSFAVLLPVGLYQAFKNRNWFNLLLIAGFFTAPIAAALVGNEYRASKELFILPFAALLATLAVKFLLNTGRQKWRILCLFLMISIFVQFTYFLYDYFNGYRARSYTWFDYDILGALQIVLDENSKKPADFFYFDSKIYYYTDRYWRFLLIERNREDLVAKTFYFDPLYLQNFQHDSLSVYRFDHTVNQSLQSSSSRLIRNILEPDGFPSFYIYRTE